MFGLGASQLGGIRARFRRFLIAHKLEMHVYSNVLAYCRCPYFLNRMDRPQDTVEEAAESVNPREQGPLAFDPSELVISDCDTKPTEALLKISHDMTRVLERLTVPKAPIDMVRRHRAEEFHGTSLEESERAEFWLEKLQRVLDEVRCPHEQRVSCAVSLLQSGAYDWLKLVLRCPQVPDPMPWNFFVQEFRAKYVTDMYKEVKWK